MYCTTISALAPRTDDSSGGKKGDQHVADANPKECHVAAPDGITQFYGDNETDPNPECSLDAAGNRYLAEVVHEICQYIKHDEAGQQLDGVKFAHFLFFGGLFFLRPGIHAHGFHKGLLE